MKHAISFDDIPYFRNQFRGDLIVATGVLYYFPHTNVSAAKVETRDMPADLVGSVAHLFGSAGLLVGLVIAVSDSRSTLRRALRASTNQPELRKSGLWREGEASQVLQQRLDAHISEVRQEIQPLVRYEYSLPKPMRFTSGEIRKLSVRLGSLRFETEYDTHEFRIGFRRQRSLRDALWESGFR